MGTFAGPEIVEDGLVLALDGANYKSFKGKDTYNYTRNSRDFSGSSYASLDEWTSNPSVLSKTYISSIATPVGNGATLIQESGSNGYHHLSRWGGSGESGAHSLSCYVFPLTSDITNFVIGMLGDGSNQISFNLNTREITYGSGISNTNAFITPVVGFDGWYRVGANIEGRYGGWVGCIGYTTSATYTGTSGNKKCYITGIQYELKTKPTMFTEAQTTRGSTVATGGGWKDLIGSNNGELVNGVSENSGNLGSLDFDGTDDYISAGALSGSFTSFTVIVWFYPTSVTGYENPIDCNYAYNGTTGNIGPRLEMNSNGNLTWIYSNITNNNNSYYAHNVVSSGLAANTWHCAAITYNGGTNTSTTYYNGNTSGLSRSTTGSPTGFVGVMNNVTIGKGFHLGGAERIFTGRVSNVSIYNKALTAQEIQQNFNATRSRFGI